MALLSGQHWKQEKEEGFQTSLPRRVQNRGNGERGFKVEKGKRGGGTDCSKGGNAQEEKGEGTVVLLRSDVQRKKRTRMH